MHGGTLLLPQIDDPIRAVGRFDHHLRVRLRRRADRDGGDWLADRCRGCRRARVCGGESRDSTLIGADLLNLHRVREFDAPVLSIAGAGTFDGIVVTGILAVLLAAI